MDQMVMAVRKNSEDDTPLGDLLAGFSLEISSRRPADIDGARHLIAAATRVFVPVVPGDRRATMVETAAALRHAGLTPVPHLAARYFASVADLDGHVARLAGEAGVEELMVIGGDRASPAGALTCAEDVLASGVLERRGIRRVGFAGYPEGHPRIQTMVLAEALRRKITLAAALGLDCHLVTQFCFHAESVLRWLRAFNACCPAVPVHIGVAGPARASTLIRYALQCGVGNSARAIMSHGGRFARLAQERTPEGLLRRLARAAAHGEAPGLAGVHFFTFGGAAETARWVSAAAAGHVTVAAGGDGSDPE